MNDAETLQLLQQVRDAVLRPQLFDALANHRKEIAELLDAHELEFTPDEERFLDDHPEGVERLYAFLADSKPPTPEESEALRAALAVKQADEQAIGTAFTKGLCRDLDKLADPTEYFESRGLQLAPDELVKVLLTRKDVAAAQPTIMPLVRYGLTPMSVFLTCDAPRTLSMRRDLDFTDALILTSDERATDRPGVVLLSEVAQEAASLDDGEAPSYYLALLTWLRDIQRMDNWIRRFMFRGFDTIAEGDDLRLKRLDGDQRLGEIDVHLQWSPERKWVLVGAGAG